MGVSEQVSEKGQTTVHTRKILRRLTPAGIEKVSDWLMADLPRFDRPRDITAPPPVDLLETPGFSEPLHEPMWADARPSGESRAWSAIPVEWVDGGESRGAKRRSGRG